MLDTLRLIGPRLLVLRDPPETQVNGLHIPDVAQTPREKVLEGTVLRVGPGGRSKKGALLPIAAQPGDRVLYGFLDGHDFEENGKRYVIIEDYEVRAILPAKVAA